MTTKCVETLPVSVEATALESWRSYLRARGAVSMQVLTPVDGAICVIMDDWLDVVAARSALIAHPNVKDVADASADLSDTGWGLKFTFQKFPDI